MKGQLCGKRVGKCPVGKYPPETLLYIQLLLFRNINPWEYYLIERFQINVLVLKCECRKPEKTHWEIGGRKWPNQSILEVARERWELKS